MASLDPPLADRLLEYVPAEQAARIRRMAVELHEVDPGEQAVVLAEFFASRRQSVPAPRELAQPEATGNRLAQSVPAPQGLTSAPAADATRTSRLEATAADVGKPGVHPAQDDRTPFRFLRHTPGTQLARLLAVERPQTIALVLAHLPEADAANTLAALPPELHLPVARRLAELEEASPDVLREVEQGLAGRMAQFQLAGARRTLGLGRLRGILQASAPTWREELLVALAAADPQLAAELQLHDEAPQAPLQVQAVDFEQLAALSDQELRGLLGKADPELVMLALAGASPGLARRCLALLEPPLARHIERSLARLGPLLLADISQAQAEVVGLLHAPPRAHAAAC